MAFRISVPAIADKQAVSVLCRSTDEMTAISLAEKKIGYLITALPYVLTGVSDEDAERAGVAEDHAEIISS